MNLFGGIFDRDRARRRKGAVSLGMAAGVLAECPVCREITDLTRDDLLDAADALAGEWIRCGDARAAAFRGDVAALRRTLREVRKGLDVMCTCEGR